MVDKNNSNETDKLISLVLGDWSGDGHSQTDTVNIHSNLTVKEIEKAYKKGSKKLGFDLTKDVAEDYEDKSLSKEIFDILTVNGFKGSIDEYKDQYSVWTDSYTDIYLFVVQIGNPEFKYKILEGESNPVINIGGYGLFSS